MTSQYLKEILDLHIGSMILLDGDDREGYFILLQPHHYIKAKYSCTTDEKEFQFINGTLTYKGFELSTTRGISPYRKWMYRSNNK